MAQITEPQRRTGVAPAVFSRGKAVGSGGRAPIEFSQRSVSVRTAKFETGFVIFAAAMAMSLSSPRADQGPFDGYQGAWSGSGTISTTNGAERIRCRAVYSVGRQGESLHQSLICASDSYRFEVVSSVAANGGRLSGDWTETTRGAAGRLSGEVSDGRFRANVSGPGFTATIAVDSSRNRQNVTITPRGSDVSKVSMVLQKGG
jgi:hypothetical protein